MKNKYYPITLLITGILFSGYIHSQSQSKMANTWYFPKNSGIDFNASSPILLNDGAVVTGEGTAVQNDKEGKLLFYMNGTTVWDKTHAVMTNGTNLWGHASSVQAALIVPQPQHNNIYYLFTTDAELGVATGSGSHCACLSYSIVDMTLAGGLGAVTTKNVFLLDTVPEALAGTMHANKCNVWIISHKYNSNSFYAYQLSDTGLSVPVISSVGSIHTGTGNFQEAIKISPDGKKIAMINRYKKGFDLFDFDNATGTIYNPRSITGFGGIFGLEFSPNSQLLYIAMPNSPGVIWQFDVSLASAAAIKASAYNVINKAITYGMMQLAPDGKIYQTRSTGTHLGLIHTPNAKGINCNYVDTGFYLNGARVLLGLPNFISNYLKPYEPAVLTSDTCLESAVQFNLPDTNGVLSVLWHFGNGDSSNNISPSLIYSNAGSYNITATVNYSCKTDTLQQSIKIQKCTTSLKEEHVRAAGIKIYPNPAGESLYIEFSASLKTPISVKLYDIMGKQQNTAGIKFETTRYNISLKNLSSGIYYVELSDGIDSFFQRIVISN